MFSRHEQEGASQSLKRLVFARFEHWHLLGGLAILLGLRIVYCIFLHPLRRVPGPFVAKFTQFWRLRKYAQGRWHEDIVDLHRFYGPVVRVSPNEVSFVDQEALVKIYGHQTGTKKTNWYDVWEIPDLATNFFATQDPKVHSFLRKRVAAAYSMSAILGLEPVIGNVLSTVWSVFDDATEDGRAVDLGLWTTYFASDVVGSLGIGGPIGFVEKRGDVHDMIKSIHRVFYFSALFGNIPGQMWWFRNALSQYVLSLVAGDGANGGAKFQAWLYNQCKNRADCPEIKDRRKDMLDHFISMKDHEGKQVTLPDVMMEAGNLIGAGADTTAAAISTVLGQLLNHPANYKRLQEEVDAAFAAMPNGSDHQLDYKTAETLPWLTACIKEGTRLMPSIVWNLPREAPSEGITIAGYYIPRSATLSISPVSHNRLKQVFGDDADEWSPSRYMIGENGTTEERLRMMEKYNVTFGYGSRTCIGRNLAMMELFRFVGQFARRYDMEAADISQPYRVRSQWFVVNENMNIILHRRKV